VRRVQNAEFATIRAARRDGGTRKLPKRQAAAGGWQSRFGIRRGPDGTPAGLLIPKRSMRTFALRRLPPAFPPRLRRKPTRGGQARWKRAQEKRDREAGVAALFTSA